jgi:hypothetical protein
MAPDPCVACGQPSYRADAALCAPCDAQLTADLCAAPGLWDDLQTTIAGAERVTTRSAAGRSAETRIPWTERTSRASTAARELHHALADAVIPTWRQLDIRVTVCSLCRTPAYRHAEGPAAEPREWLDEQVPLGHVNWAVPDALAGWLLRWRRGLSQHPDGRYVRAIRRAVRQARAAIDIPIDGRVYLGECVHQPDHTQSCPPDCDQHTEVCGADLYGTKGEPYARCAKCGSEYDVPETQAWMRDQVRHEVAPAKLLAGLLSRLGVPVTARDIHGLARAQLLLHAGMDSGKRRTYRAGDVLDALARRDEPEGSVA